VSPLRAEREFRVYPSLEPQADVDELPPDWNQPAEFVVARMMYPNGRGFGFFGMGGDWRQGGTAWAVDYPRGDRRLAQILRRMTRIDVRSVEQPVNLDDGNDVYDWPFMIVGLPGMWDLTDEQVGDFPVVPCALCGGVLKPDVVFFGENVPPERVQRAMAPIASSDAMLVIGSSLMIYSGYRFVTAAADAGKPIAAINIGRTRADYLLALKVEDRCANALRLLTC